MRSFAAKRGHRSGLLEPHQGIELLGHYGLEIMAEEFGLGTVNHADRAFEQWLPQRIGKVAARRSAPVRQGARKAGAAERVLIAVRTRRANRLDLQDRKSTRLNSSH